MSAVGRAGKEGFWSIRGAGEKKKGGGEEILVHWWPKSGFSPPSFLRFRDATSDPHSSDILFRSSKTWKNKNFPVFPLFYPHPFCVSVT